MKRYPEAYTELKRKNATESSTQIKNDGGALPECRLEIALLKVEMKWTEGAGFLTLRLGTTRGAVN